MKNYFFLLLLLVSGISACGDNYVTEHYHLENQSTTDLQYAGEGVYLDVANQYSKARTYDGFQARGGKSSISVKLTDTPIEELKKDYESTQLKKRRANLKELSTVDYNGNTNAFYAVTEEEKQGTIRYLLAIRENDVTYLIKAFAFANRHDYYRNNIKQALLSTYIGNPIDIKAAFTAVQADNKQSTNIIYHTRDGKYPTESTDQAVIKTEFVNIKGFTETTYLQQTLTELTGGKAYGIGTEFLANAKYHCGKSQTDKMKAYAGLVPAPVAGGHLLMIASGNAVVDLMELETYVRDQLIKAKIR